MGRIRRFVTLVGFGAMCIACSLVLIGSGWVENSTLFVRQQDWLLETEHYQSLSYDELRKWPGAESNSTNSSDTSTHIGEPLFVHLLSYQRSGSSFLGGLFHSNPDAFFIYEPMDMLYSAMYGFQPGWSVPADLFYTSNGHLRKIPAEEVETSAWLLEKIFTCQMSTLPVPILIHRFWHMFQTDMPIVERYVHCLQQNKVDVANTHERCRQNIATVCPKRFSQGARNLESCRNVLWNSGKWRADRTEVQKHFQADSVQNFMRYFSCIDNYEKTARACAQQELDNVCSMKRVRVVKTVRSDFDVSKVILDKYRQSKVIHLVRDPRGAARSRTLARWSWGIHEGKSARERAERYCARAADDNRKRLRFSAAHRGRSLRLIYDEMIKNITQYSQELHDFLDIRLSEHTRQFINNATKETVKKKAHGTKISRKNTTSEVERYVDRGEKWKYFFSAKEIQDIREVCKQFYSEIPSSWA